MSESNLTAGEAQAWDALAREAASAGTEAAAIDEIRQLLAFELDGTAYAVPVEQVTEIVRMRPVTPVPRFPEDVLGVISLRGEIVELIDLRRRLGLAPTSPTRRSRIIVASNSAGEVAGMLVDSVREVLRIPSEAIRPAAGSESSAVEGLCAVGDQFVSMIELDRVLTVDA
jgi:purine-binding chemotaxis protein CheW